MLDIGAVTNGTSGTPAQQTITIRSPSLDLNFAAMYNPSVQMSQAPYNQITFTRASTATYTDCDGSRLKTAAVNVPRIDCNPTTGQPNGLIDRGESDQHLIKFIDIISDFMDNFIFYEHGFHSNGEFAIGPR